MEVSDKAKACCTMEKKRLVEELRKCTYCSTSMEENDSCWHEAAVESGKRAKQCLVT